MLQAYTACLAVAIAGAMLSSARWRDAALCRCALAILANWLVGMAISATGWTDAWWPNIALDGVTAYIVLRRPAGRWQSALGVSYCLQILMHIGYGLVLTFAKGADAMAYYEQLTGVAFLQLAILGGWAIDLWGNRTRRADRGLCSAQEGASRLDGPR